MSPPPKPLQSITTFPDPAIYQALGTEGVHKLLRAFYRNLGASSISDLFPQTEEGLMEAADKSALFFVGICGGPPLYEQKYGAPRMRQRHASFVITDHARIVWLSCWDSVLDTATAELGFPAKHLANFREYLVSFSLWMVNA